jgi:hypothetical protein
MDKTTPSSRSSGNPLHPEEQEGIIGPRGNLRSALHRTGQNKITCDVSVTPPANSILNATNNDGRKYWDAAWERATEPAVKKWTQQKRLLQKKLPSQAKRRRSTGPPQQLQLTLPKRRSTARTTSQKTTGQFPLFIIWKVKDDVQYFTEEYAKNVGNINHSKKKKGSDKYRWLLD